MNFWTSFVQWFADVIQWMYLLTGQVGLPNYGLAIIFMTIAIKLVMFPLTQKQMHSMRAMQQLQPKMKYLQDKYKDNPQMMQTKTMELYKEHGVSPFSSCLPLLVQMPIFIAFYQSLLKFEFAVPAHASFLGISNIGESVWALTVSQGAFWTLYIPILAGLTTYLQQKISTVDSKDPTQRTMLYMMPLFMAWIAATLPAGLPIYWIMFNILGILQQLYVNQSSPASKAEMAMPEAAVNTLPENKTNAKTEAVKQSAAQPIEKKETTKNFDSKEEKAAGRTKGGKKKSGNTKYRKAGKKRR